MATPIIIVAPLQNGESFSICSVGKARAVITYITLTRRNEREGERENVALLLSLERRTICNVSVLFSFPLQSSSFLSLVFITTEFCSRNRIQMWPSLKKFRIIREIKTSRVQGSNRLEHQIHLWPLSLSLSLSLMRQHSPANLDMTLQSANFPSSSSLRQVFSHLPTWNCVGRFCIQGRQWNSLFESEKFDLRRWIDGI